MASARTIAGENGLPTADEAELGDDTWLESDTNNRNSKKINAALLRFLLGDVGASGDVTSEGKLGDFTLSIVNGRVTLAMNAPLAAHSVVGNPTGSNATPRALQMSSDDFAFVGDVIHATAAAGASDASPEYDYENYGGAL